MTFPATATRPAHTATPADPHWSPLGQASAGIAAAAAAGRITPGQATEQLKQLYGADADATVPEAAQGRGEPP